MSIKEYYQQFEVIHTNNCKVCNGMSLNRTITRHLSFWVVVDTILLIITAITALFCFIYIIQGTV